jgi:hypothetical protein
MGGIIENKLVEISHHNVYKYIELLIKDISIDIIGIIQLEAESRNN